MSSTPSLGVRPFDNRDPDRLGFALLLSAAVHAIALFGIGFAAISGPEAPPSLAVTIALDDSPQAPETADFLAQRDQLGSGEQRTAEELTNDREAEFSAERITAALPASAPALPSGGAAAAPERPPLVTSTAGRPAPVLPEPSAAIGEPVPTAAIPIPPGEEVASLKAKLDDLRRNYSRAPRVLRVTSVSTKAAEAALYLDYWETLVEQVGNQHYPEEARRNRTFGSLRLAVLLRADGTVEKVDVLQSSGHRVLDLAAIRTIRLAAPFAPFPPELARWDRLEIIRTWQFAPGNRLRTSGEAP